MRAAASQRRDRTNRGITRTRSSQLLLSPFDFSHVREHAYSATILRLALADLDPATIPLLMQNQPFWIAMLRKPLLDPFLRSRNRVGHDPALHHGLDQMLELQPWLQDVGDRRIELAIARVAQHHAIVGVEDEKPSEMLSSESVSRVWAWVALSRASNSSLTLNSRERSSIARSLSKSAYAASTAATKGLSEAGISSPTPRCFVSWRRSSRCICVL